MHFIPERPWGIITYYSIARRGAGHIWPAVCLPAYKSIATVLKFFSSSLAIGWGFENVLFENPPIYLMPWSFCSPIFKTFHYFSENSSNRLIKHLVCYISSLPTVHHIWYNGIYFLVHILVQSSSCFSINLNASSSNFVSFQRISKINLRAVQNNMKITL